MVASHVDTNMLGLGEFVRRQLLVGRRYATRMWLLCFGALTVSLVALWGSVAVFGWRLLGGQGASWWLLANAGGLYLMHSVRAWLRQDLTKTYLPALNNRLAAARRFDTWLSPVAGLLLWGGYAISCIGNEIVWRGIGYVIAPGGRIRLLGRELPQLELSRPALPRHTGSVQQPEEADIKIHRAA
jgi:hypothetical protein